MYKLTNEESVELGTFLRMLCRLDMLKSAKAVAALDDATLSNIINTRGLWSLVASDQSDLEKELTRG
jgi:hypothetical protein